MGALIQNLKVRPAYPWGVGLSAPGKEGSETHSPVENDVYQERGTC